MRTRGTLILLVLFAALAGYVFLVERKRPSKEEEAAAAAVVLRFDPAAVTGLRFAFRESTIALARRDGRWAVIEPLAAPADENAIAALLAVFDSLTAERRIPAAEVDSVAAGMTAPWVRLAITLSDSTRHEIAAGSVNPLGNAYYARVDRSPELCLLALDTVDANLKPALFSLRDRRLAPFDPAAARRIEIATAERTLVLAATDGEWRLREPPLAADQNAVREFLDRLATLEAIAFPFAATGAADLARTGLTDPGWSAVVSGAGDSLLARLAFGAPVPELGAAAPAAAGTGAGRYAMGSAERAVAIVADRVPGEFPPTLFALRDKRLLDLGPAEIDTLEVAGGGTTIVAARDSSGHFQQVGTQTADQTAPADQLDRLAMNLPHVLVTRFADETATGPSVLRGFGLDPPYVRLRLRLSNGEARVVLLGHADPEGDGVFAHRAGSPGVVVVGHATAGDLIQLVYGERALPPSASPAAGAP
jgi:hypothetical protein